MTVTTSEKFYFAVASISITAALGYCTAKCLNENKKIAAVGLKVFKIIDNWVFKPLENLLAPIFSKDLDEKMKAFNDLHAQRDLRYKKQFNEQ